MSYVLRIQRPGPVDVAGPLASGPAIGEDRELVILGVELEYEAIETNHAAQLAKVAGHLLEVQLRGQPMRHLHGITAAQACRLRALLAFEPLEAAAAATRTVHLAQ